MANKTIKMIAQALIGRTNLSLRLHRRGRAGIVNGTGTAATINAAGEVTAVVPDAFGYPEEVLAVSIYETVQQKVLWYPDADSYVYIPVDALGTYYVSAQAIDEMQRALREFPPQVRSIDDATDQFFFWPHGSGKSLTAQRSVNGGALQACVGTVTDSGVAQPISGKYRYKLNYNAADRAVGTVAYRFTDASSNQVGTLVVNFLSEGVGSGSVTVLPGSLAQQQRNIESTLIVIVGETVTQARSILAANGVPLVLTGRTLKVYIEDMRRVQIVTPITATVASATTFTVALPADVVASERPLRFSVWDETGDKVMLAAGHIEVRYEPGP
jgi:hypothetical protein